jgi:hypothetical protein
MADHLYPRFLRDSNEYALSERHWARLWEEVDPPARIAKGWQQPWFQPLPPSLGEGNPIFSAVSRMLRRGIRVIQHEPTESGLEIQAWFDVFGGGLDDPERIEELVISCALSDAASSVARLLIERWISGGPVGLDSINPIGSLISVASTEADHARGKVESLHRRPSTGPDSG